jgi:pimeloyl-ACP methyl ester carboxylesterase
VIVTATCNGSTVAAGGCDTMRTSLVHEHKILICSNKMKSIERTLIICFVTISTTIAAFVVPARQTTPKITIPWNTASATTSLLLIHSTKYTVECPVTSPATGLTNRFYTWKNQQKIRYQTTLSDDSSSEQATAKQPILFIHGLFTNSDHWRHSLKYFASMSDTYTAYAIDLYGCGYSDKPLADSEVAQACNGEYHRFVNDSSSDVEDGVLRNVRLGSSDGRLRSDLVDVELRHPIGSPYNFYTWADLIVDFCNDVISPSFAATTKVSLVCNSIGTMSSLQAVLDHPTLFNGVFVISPNFRELHSAEVPFSSITMPVVRMQQSLLRNVIGQPLFDTLAKPEIVGDILKVPYAVKDAVDDELVQVLLDPLLTPGASNVVFDLLSYSAGPLPEPQLQQLSTLCNNTSTSLPVWVCYGSDDPWTPGRRVEALKMNNDVVQKVVCLPGVGHCPHDEAPELVHPLLMEFLQHISTMNMKTVSR